MSEPRRTAFATVSVVLEIETGSWGPDCTIGQAVKQAEEEAVERVRRLLAQATQSDVELKVKRDTLHGVRVVAVGKVTTRLTEDRT